MVGIFVPIDIDHRAPFFANRAAAFVIFLQTLGEPVQTRR